jgi:nucleoside-diphosphate-sugar epimerase
VKFLITGGAGFIGSHYDHASGEGFEELGRRIRPMETGQAVA